MSNRRCPDCGMAEERKIEPETGRMATNLDPISGRCIGCLGRQAVKQHTFRSRRVDQAGKVVDIRKRAVGDSE